MRDLYAVQASQEIGPIYIQTRQKQDRDYYAHAVGETCSLTDRVFQDKISQQKLDFQPHPWRLLG